MGMGCVDNFTANCLGKEREKQKWVENTVAGAKATFSILCGNKEVRDREYRPISPRAPHFRQCSVPVDGAPSALHISAVPWSVFDSTKVATFEIESRRRARNRPCAKLKNQTFRENFRY